MGRMKKSRKDLRDRFGIYALKDMDIKYCINELVGVSYD